MTEFVLGKIKFTWKGNWAVTTAYEKDDIIKFGGNTYVCTTGHTTGGTIPDFYTDIAKWDVHVEGVTHKGDHADATFYKINDIVKLKNQHWKYSIKSQLDYFKKKKKKIIYMELCYNSNQ